MRKSQKREDLMEPGQRRLMIHMHYRTTRQPRGGSARRWRWHGWCGKPLKQRRGLRLCFASLSQFHISHTCTGKRKLWRRKNLKFLPSAFSCTASLALEWNVLNQILKASFNHWPTLSHNNKSVTDWLWYAKRAKRDDEINVIMVPFNKI